MIKNLLFLYSLVLKLNDVHSVFKHNYGEMTMISRKLSFLDYKMNISR